MYDNIGRKIKILAKAIFIIEAIAAAITGITLMLSDEDSGIVALGLLILLLVPFLAWVFSWVLYGFGEIIDKVCEIERNTRSGIRTSETQAKIDADRIDKIEKLRSQGLITEEEYQQAITKNNMR